jgi:hypothetical protein
VLVLGVGVLSALFAVHFLKCRGGKAHNVLALVEQGDANASVMAMAAIFVNFFIMKII